MIFQTFAGNVAIGKEPNAGPRMKRIASGSIAIAQGSQLLFSDFADGGPMWTGHGPRESRHGVIFSQTFREAPAVTVSISMWDMDQKTNLRADICAEKITEAGFQIVFRTWGTRAWPGSARTGSRSVPCGMKTSGTSSEPSPADRAGRPVTDQREYMPS